MSGWQARGHGTGGTYLRTLGPLLAVGLALLLSPVAGSSPGRVTVVSQAPPPSSSGGTLTGTLSDPTGAYLPPSDFLKFTISGADLKRAATREVTYEGTPTGKTITLTGQMSVTVAKNYVSDVTMSARVGDKAWQWPPKGQSTEVRNQTVTQSFNLTFAIGVDTPGLGGDYVTGSASLNVCGGICSGYSVAFTVHFKKAPTTTTKPTATTPKPGEPVDWPTVQAFPVLKPWPLRPATYAWLPYTVKDASGKAKVAGTLYEGGTGVLDGASKYFLVADGRKYNWKARLAADLTGPLRYCVWAVNPKGRESVLAPKSSCAWLSLLVDIDRVSNGCGGEGWDSIEWAENLFGNVHTYYDSGTGRSYTVSFVDACNLHDAGYGGMTVHDKINNRTIDFRTWSRKMVDDNFWRDMKKLCDEQIKDPAATVALAKCKGVGGGASIGSEWLYNKVRYWGSHFFDADLTRPGHQASGHRDNS